MSIYFTSDTHFGHLRIAELAGRPWTDVDEMNEAIIQNYNSVVASGDTCYFLGDIALGKIDQSLPLVNRLNGYKILIPGNHDRVFSHKSMDKYRERFRPEYLKVFQEIHEENSVKYFMNNEWNQWFAVSHLPYIGDSHSDEDRYKSHRMVDEGLPMLCGHVHEKWRIKDKQFNVGVDANDYKPVHLDTLMHWAKVLWESEHGPVG